MTVHDWASITDFALAGVCLFVAGALMARTKRFGSASWFWSATIFSLALGAFLSGIDHGFIEPRGILPSTNIATRVSWAFVGFAIAFMLMTTGRQFMPNQGWVAWLAAVQLIAFIILICIYDSFIIVSADAIPELLALLALAMAGLKSGRGSWQLILGLIALIVASVLQAIGFDAFTPFDHNSVYHTISIGAGVLFYFAGRKLDGYAA